MKNSQRILDSIGKLSDSMIESALSYESPENKREKIKDSSARPMKRLAVSLVAAVMCIALAVTCFANADLIKSLFQREQELVDPYALKVDNSVTVGDITLTIDKVAWGDEYYVYYTIKNNNGIFDKGLTFDRIAIKEGDIGFFTNRDTVGIIDGPEERGSDPDSSIALVGYGLENPSDTISAMFRTDLDSGEFTFAFENVTSYDGSVKYADEIAFELELPKMSDKPGIVKKYRDLIGAFNLEGKEMALESIRFTPYGVTVFIREYGTDTVNYFGHDFYYSAYIEGFSFDTSKVQLDQMLKDCLVEREYYDTELNEYTTEYGGVKVSVKGYPETATIKIPIRKEDDLDPMERYEISQDIYSHEAELEKYAYKVYAKLADGCTAEIITRTQNAYVGSQRFDDGTIDCHIKSLVELKFSTPVYEEEILEIYLLREFDGARVTIYEKPE